MLSPISRRYFRVLALVIFFADLGAATSTWDCGGGGNNWTTGNNWNPNGVPGCGDNVVFGTAGACVDLDTCATVGMVTFNRAANFLIDNCCGDLTINTGITACATGFTYTIEPDVILGCCNTWNVGACTTLVICDDVCNSNNDLLVTGAGNITIDDDYRGGSGSITMCGTGVFLLDGGDNSDYSGGTIVNSGTFTATINGDADLGRDQNNQNVLGTGNVTVNGGTLNLCVTGNNCLDMSCCFVLTVNGGILNFSSGDCMIFDDCSSVVINCGTANFCTGDNFEIDSDITVNGGTVCFTSTDDIDIDDNNSNIVINAGNVTMCSGCNIEIDNGCGITVTGGTLTMVACNDLCIFNDSGISQTDGTITFTGDNVENDGCVTVNGACAVQTWTTNCQSRVDNGTLSIINGGTLTATGGNMIINDDATLSGNGACSGTLNVLNTDLCIHTCATISNCINITMNNTGCNSISMLGGCGCISNVGTLRKTGAGTVTIDSTVNLLTANNIIIDSGTLTTGAADQIADTTNIILDGGTLSTGTGFSDVVQNMTLSSTSTIALGAGVHTLQLDDLILAAGTLNITGWTGTAGSSGTAGRLTVVAGSMTLNGGSLGTALSGVNFAGYNNGYDIIDLGGGIYEIVPSAVPEPSTWVGGCGLLIGAIIHFRQRRIKAANTRSMSQQGRDLNPRPSGYEPKDFC